MKILGLMPVRNDAWVLEHSLRALAGFCDWIIVSDQSSDDGSREICRRFPKVVLIESAEARVCEAARWQLVDAARAYDGCNLWWWNDADELVAPGLAAAALGDDLSPGAAIECAFYHLWDTPGRYRDDRSLYRPQRKQMAIVDDRHLDYDRSSSLPLHQPRVEVLDPCRVIQTDVPVLHLQWLIEQRNQMKQAWYRCREWLAGDQPVEQINRKYAITLPPRRVKTSPVPAEWVAGLTLPDFASADREPSWHEREILGWFSERGTRFFEPLEIWHVPSLQREFLLTTGRRPRPDRAHHPTAVTQARQLTARVLAAGRRRFAS